MRYILLTGWIILLTFCKVAAQGGYDNLRSEEVRVVNGKSFFVHQVRRGQTLYSISRAYHVEMQVIIDVNPEIKNGLKANQTLLIPAPGSNFAADTVRPSIPPDHSPPAEFRTRTVEDEREQPVAAPRTLQSPCGRVEGSQKKTYDVALMMHFFLDEADSMNTEKPTQEEIESYNPLRYIQFYEGFLLAADSLRKTGLSLNLYVYNVDTEPSATYAVLRKPEMKGMDLIIGMLFNQNFQILANWALEHQIPVVSPVSERESQVEGNPMVIKVKPSSESEGTVLTGFLSLHYPYAPVMIIRSWEPEVRKMADMILSRSKASGMNAFMVDEGELIGRMNRGMSNIIVVLSDQKPFVMEVLSRLNVDTTGYRFTVFGLPRWDNMEGLDYQYLERARTYMLVPSWIDYQDPAVTRFVTCFRERFKTEPDPLAFQGYDVGWYFLEALKRYGNGFIGCLKDITVKPLHTVYKFRQRPGGGWENHHWEMFSYGDYTRISLD